MATSLNDNLPEVLKRVRTQPLLVMRLDVRKLLIVGATPGAYRRIGVVPGGSFEGERLSGEVLDGGSDWSIRRAIISGSIPYSRRRPRSTIGSIALSG
jgi:Protein of unknown function (DUF3237)